MSRHSDGVMARLGEVGPAGLLVPTSHPTRCEGILAQHGVIPPLVSLPSPEALLRHTTLAYLNAIRTGCFYFSRYAG